MTPDQKSLTIENQRRLIWAVTRSYLEADNYKRRKYGEKRRRRWSWFKVLINMFGRAIRLTPLYRQGLENARNIVVNEIDLFFGDLPELFHRYTILHMTDLHVDFVPGIEQTIRKCIRGLAVDLCVLTGDFRAGVGGGFKKVVTSMERIVSETDAVDGILATLGNHDTYQMVEPFERIGMTLLANESVEIVRGDARICVTGLDDPYYYYTDRAVTALEETGNGFKIALVHAPSMFDVAADNGYALYLCGHTHGGQICLPGGRPIITHLRHGRKFYRGLWRYGKMTGYTGQGTGTVGIPLRFNTQSEITVLRLNRARA
ncbi:MAG: metallophosphoesterase [Desulfobacterales bacterium]|nr:metallophosphoesterase [Desulfobacterales bacterium]